MRHKGRVHQTQASRLLEEFKAASHFRALPLAGHAVTLALTAFVAAYIKSSLTVATLVSAISIGIAVTVFILAVIRLQDTVDTLGGVLLRIDYMKVHALHNGAEVTEASIYKRAASEIQKAHESIDVFTSYLLEVNSDNKEDERARDSYFNDLLSFLKVNSKLTYRRIIQAPANVDLEDALGHGAKVYLDHLAKMVELEKDGKRVHLGSIDHRRPTTFVIIDDRLLLWQVNQVGADGEIQMHGMFFVQDPNQELLQHFREEFDHYWDTEAKPVKLSSGLRS